MHSEASLPGTTCYVAVTSCHNGDLVAEFRLHVFCRAAMFRLISSQGSSALALEYSFYSRDSYTYKHMHVCDRP